MVTARPVTAIPGRWAARGRHLAGRAVARGLASLATFGRAVQIGMSGFVYLVTDLVTLRFPWRDAVRQAWLLVTVTAIPAVLVSVPFGVIVAVQVGSLTQQVGASSVSGAAGGLGVIQQGAPIVVALLIGGAGGAAIASDLGARSMREEIDALRSMGVDPLRRLVAPRMAAIIAVAPLLCMLVIFMGLTTGYVIAVTFQDITPGSYSSSFSAFASTSDLAVAVAKSLIFGVVVVVIAAQRGLETRYGPKAVADSVNAAVVLGVVVAFGINLVITQLVTMFLPQRVG
ncbi:MlaE family ABC transporter permease [Gordonia aurantiaca]|uniref:MlaE family ABC transporter permease n=1 Tax=Gordonia sp. B21 TaxID=3151852 RepID=UPI0032666107